MDEVAKAADGGIDVFGVDHLLVLVESDDLLLALARPGPRAGCVVVADAQHRDAPVVRRVELGQVLSKIACKVSLKTHLSSKLGEIRLLLISPCLQLQAVHFFKGENVKLGFFLIFASLVIVFFGVTSFRTHHFLTTKPQVTLAHGVRFFIVNC